MIAIREMTKEDIEGVLEVERDSFSTPWTEQLFYDEVNNPHTVYYICTVGEEIIGYAGMWHVLDEGQITNIAVKSRFRKMGVGSMLLKELINRAEKDGISVMGLEVRESNQGALSLYQKFGFKPVGNRKNYYKNPTENAVLMDLELKNG